MVSIKNRYNHTVENPDATYGNDLDKIVPGLADSFARLIKSRGYYYSDANVEQLRIPGYVVGPDKRYYKYNFETDGIYFCPGNIIIDGHNISDITRENVVLPHPLSPSITTRSPFLKLIVILCRASTSSLEEL